MLKENNFHFATSYARTTHAKLNLYKEMTKNGSFG